LSLNWQCCSCPSCSSAQESWRASTSYVRGLCRSLEGRKVCSNGGGGRSEELVNNKFPTLPLI
jgi:hypothetical protein